jgi:hypothetical protein
VLIAVLSAPAGAEDFEVQVLRGSTISQVSGDGSGPLSEVTVREDPYPPPVPTAPEERPFEPEIVIRIDPAETRTYVAPPWRYPLHRPLLHRPPPRTRLHDWGARHQRGDHRLGSRPPRSALSGGPRGLRSTRR